MNPDVSEAVERLAAEGFVTPEAATHLRRVARRELVSVRFELRALLYVGVLLLTTGVGLLVKENYERIGPLAIAIGIGLVAAACLAYAVRTSPPFSWGEVRSPNIAFDYVLLLGLLLVGTDLAYVESRFRLLGPSWAYHLLLVSALYLLAAYRFDSKTVLSLALSTFAAWRGVAVANPLAPLLDHATEAVRANALGCGALFLAAGWASARAAKKPHFEVVFTNLGLLLGLGALLSGVFAGRFAQSAPWELALLVASGAAVFLAARSRRSLPFAQGVIALYLGFLRVLFEGAAGAAALLVMSASSVAVLVFIILAHRRFRSGA